MPGSVLLGFRFQTTLPVRGATIQLAQISQNTTDFNPRSPCGERRQTITPCAVIISISTHAPRAGSDGRPTTGGGMILLFQPTLPVRGATGRDFILLFENSDFNPRSPCGERHAKCAAYYTPEIFQPTLPVRGATYRTAFRATSPPISTHAPRAGSDIPCLFSTSF